MLKVVARTRIEGPNHQSPDGVDLLELVSDDFEKYDTRTGPGGRQRIIVWVQKKEIVLIKVNGNREINIGDKITLKQCCQIAHGKSGLRSVVAPC